MVAVLTSTSAPLRQVGGSDTARPGRETPGSGGRPNLRVIDGGRAPRRPLAVGHTSPGVFLRRRIVVGVAALAFLAMLVVGVGAMASLLAEPATSTTTTASTGTAALVPIATDTYVVHPGDTLWSIASRLDPAGDPRPLVDALRERAGGAALETGQRIDVAGLGA